MWVLLLKTQLFYFSLQKILIFFSSTLYHIYYFLLLFKQKYNYKVVYQTYPIASPTFGPSLLNRVILCKRKEKNEEVFTTST
jgi:hypothetical protein